LNAPLMRFGDSRSRIVTADPTELITESDSGSWLSRDWTSI